MLDGDILGFGAASVGSVCDWNHKGWTVVGVYHSVPFLPAHHRMALLILEALPLVGLGGAALPPLWSYKGPTIPFSFISLLGLGRGSTKRGV